MRRLFCAILLPAAFAARALPAQTPDSLTRDQKWRADLQFMATQLPALHKNAFANTTKPAFDSAVARLDARIPNLSDGQIGLELSAIVGSLHDSHTMLRLPAVVRQLSMLPVAFRWLDDGIFIVGADADHNALVGARVVAINKTKAEDVARRAASYTSWDNQVTLRRNAATAIMFSEILQGIGVARANEPITIETDKQTVQLTPIAVAAGGARIRSAVDQLPQPLYLSNARANYWYKLLDGGTMYIQYNRCLPDPAKPFPQFASEVLAAIDSAKAKKVVVDLRLNGGGNSALFYPLATGLKTWLTSTPGAKLYALTGETTFSSAVINAADLKKIGAIVAGQPTGGRPNHFGEVRTMALPYSKLTIAYSTNYFETLPGYKEESIMPDLAVPVLSADFFAAKDPVLEKVLAN